MRLTQALQHAINGRFALGWWEQSPIFLHSPQAQNPTRPNSNSPLKVCGGSVFGIPVTEFSCAALGVLGLGNSAGRKCLNAFIIPEKRLILEDSLCAPGSLLLRS